MLFIRYFVQSKGHLYGEHSNDSMAEIDSCSLDFLEDEFPTIGEIKKDVQLFELQPDIQPSFGKGENLNSNEVIEDGTSPLFDLNAGELSAQENKIRFQSPIHEESQHVNKVHPNLLFSNMQLVHMFRIPHLKGIVGVILHMLRVPQLLEKGGRMPHPSEQIMKVPGSEGASVEEFVNDISKSKRKYSYRLPWKLKSQSPIKRQLIHQTIKSGWMV